jgi:hypothetical protein
MKKVHIFQINKSLPLFAKFAESRNIFATKFLRKNKTRIETKTKQGLHPLPSPLAE